MLWCDDFSGQKIPATRPALKKSEHGWNDGSGFFSGESTEIHSDFEYGNQRDREIEGPKTVFPLNYADCTSSTTVQKVIPHVPLLMPPLRNNTTLATSAPLLFLVKRLLSIPFPPPLLSPSELLRLFLRRFPR